MKDYKRLATLMERIAHKYNQVENRKRPYGDDLILTRAEIHTLVAVGDNPGINVTNLAKHLGITKGGASQMIYKLVDKGLVIKKVSPESDTEVVLSLTDAGIGAYDMHTEYHKKADEMLFAQLKGLDDKTYDLLVELMQEYEKSMDDLINQ